MDSKTDANTNLPPPSGQPSAEGIGTTQQGHGKGLTLEPIAAGFDPACVRCAAESRLHELIWKDEDLLTRIKALTQERDDSRIQTRLGLITDGYRVDEAITPKLFRLGVMLTKILRLAQPLDIFVRCSEELNAFCLPSRKGNRLIMCLHSSLVASLSSQELLFTMGHEVGHALLKHGETLGITFDNPHFSPMEVVRLRALHRAQEVSCDRMGLLACQDVRVASTALFKIGSGLTEKWICFDEAAYARHFDELSSMAELVDLEDASRTHPFDPLRVKALIAFSN
jgi:Zn-dependent protease with chaperone function